MVSKKIELVISKFIKSVKELDIKIDKIIIFGSYAKGNYKKESDIDLAVISPSFGRDHYEESKLLRQLAWRIDARLEPVPISTKSFKDNQWIPLINEIKTGGLEINKEEIAA